jgi:hypothetical protein
MSRLSFKNFTTGSLFTELSYQDWPPGLHFASSNAYCRAERAAERKALTL